LSKLLCFINVYLSFALQICFVSHKTSSETKLFGRKTIQFVSPSLCSVKRFFACNIIYEQAPLRTSVVAGWHRLKFFTSICVLKLQLDSLSINIYNANFELYANCINIFRENSVHITLCEAAQNLSKQVEIAVYLVFPTYGKMGERENVTRTPTSPRRIIRNK